ncbi:MAG: hypothetical protein LUQ20_08015 [Candidatus Methanoperedens sp.]|nr:hypothetical protein [Candidatus Methanoperedens sp.]
MSTDYGICSMLHSSCNEFTPRGQWTLTLRDRLDALYDAGIITTYKKELLLIEIANILKHLSHDRKKDLTPFEAEPIFEQVLQKYELLDDWNSIKSKTIPYSLFFTLLGGAHDVYFTE